MPITLSFPVPRRADPRSAIPIALPLTTPGDFQAHAAEAANLLKALANPARLLLLCQLVKAECTVTELGVRACMEQPSLSQQLAVLRRERLVATRRQGKNVLYRIASPASMTVLETLHGLFCGDMQPSAAVTRFTPARRSPQRAKVPG